MTNCTLCGEFIHQGYCKECYEEVLDEIETLITEIEIFLNLNDSILLKPTKNMFDRILEKLTNRIGSLF